MIRIYFHTNLDIVKRYVNTSYRDWEHVPRVGDRVSFPHPTDSQKSFALRVCDVTWPMSDFGRCVNIELHIPTDNESIREFTERMKRHLGHGE